MKNCFKITACLAASLLMATTAFAEKVELYALDGRTLFVDQAQVEVYTKEGMGWFLEKPVTMYAEDGRTIVVTADNVEAYKNVGWYLEGELDKAKDTSATENNSEVKETETKETVKNETVKVMYTDSTVVTVPAAHFEMYKALGWVAADGEAQKTVVMYDKDGTKKIVPLDEVSKYELAGWSIEKPDGKYITVYNHKGDEKDIPENSYETYKSQGWYSAYDEAVYAYAAFGDGADVQGATELLENKKYEMAFNAVQDALNKIENTDSEYVSMLYYLRSMVTDAWREAANSPLGFINYWFSEKDDKHLVVFEYRNVSNSRIQSFRINFDICDKDGTVIETNQGSYFVNNLQMTPCEKKRVGWVIKSGDQAVSIKNLKVNEVVFSDGTKWTPSV